MTQAVQIKAQGLLNAAKWIEEEYGRDALGTVVRACGPSVRERYVSAIAINWHPLEELIEFVQKADQLLGRGNGRMAEAIGAAGARANMKGIVVRIAFYIAQPEFFFRRVASLWRQFNDEGEMIVHHIDDHSGMMEIRGVLDPHPVFCGVLTGWVRQIAAGIGIQSPAVRHTECICRGDGRCIWDVRWTAIREEEKKVLEGHDSLARLPTRPPSRMPPPPESGPRTPASGPHGAATAPRAPSTAPPSPPAWTPSTVRPPKRGGN